MKRILSLLLALLCVAGVLALSACSGGGGNDATQDAATQDKATNDGGDKTTAVPTPDPTQSETPVPSDSGDQTTVTFDDKSGEFFTSLLRNTTTYEHTKAESLPSNATLVGTDTLPAVYQRTAEISNPAADAVTYMQYTNAVARYIKSKDPNSTISPSTDKSICYSTKYAGQFGASIADDYHVLMDNGALTFAEDDFARRASGEPIVKDAGQYNTDTTGWLIDEGTGDKSLAYRLISYEDINAADNTHAVEIDGYYNNRYGSIEITKSENGQKLLEKIKDAIVTGNVVVAVGKIYAWQLEQLPANSGQGKEGDTVIGFAIKLSDADASDKVKNADYPICIVGYDDKLSFTTHEQTTTGALLVCNPGDKSWGNGGYAWIMYDALNTYFDCMSDEASKEAFVLENESDVRTHALSRYTFVYWDKDITDQKPTLYAEIELVATNRNTFQFLMTKTDAYGRTSSIYAWQSYMTAHNLFDTYGIENEEKEDGKDPYFNPAGELNGGSVRGYYTVSFERLLTNLPVGTTFDQFALALRVYNGDENYPVTVNSIKFKDATGNVIKKVTLPKDTAVTKGYFNIKINFGKELTPDILAGNYFTFRNKATGQWLLKDSDKPTVSMGDYSEKKICWFRIEYTSKTNLYKLFWKKKAGTYTQPLDLQDAKVATDGAKIVINPMDAKTRDATQYWYISYNTDGTFSLYLQDETGEVYALASPDEGKIPVVKKVTTEVTDDMKWEMSSDFDDSYKSPYTCTVTANEGTVHVEANTIFSKAQIAALGVDTLKVSVYNITTGKRLATEDIALDNNNLKCDIEVSNLPAEFFVVVSNIAKTESDKDYTMYPVNATLFITL